MSKPDVTSQRLRESLHYDPETGAFVWIAQTSKRIQIGGVAGSQDSKGYVRIGIDGEYYPAHRLAWLYVTGAWPADQIDHRNGVRDDNSWLNLREANRFLNGQNQRLPHTDNKSGFLGVCWHKASGKWRAQIKIDGRVSHLGLFATAADAHNAYLVAKRNLHPGCTI